MNHATGQDRWHWSLLGLAAVDAAGYASVVPFFALWVSEPYFALGAVSGREALWLGAVFSLFATVQFAVLPLWLALAARIGVGAAVRRSALLAALSYGVMGVALWAGSIALFILAFTLAGGGSVLHPLLHRVVTGQIGNPELRGKMHAALAAVSGAAFVLIPPLLRCEALWRDPVALSYGVLTSATLCCLAVAWGGRWVCAAPPRAEPETAPLPLAREQWELAVALFCFSSCWWGFLKLFPLWVSDRVGTKAPFWAVSGVGVCCLVGQLSYLAWGRAAKGRLGVMLNAGVVVAAVSALVAASGPALFVASGAGVALAYSWLGPGLYVQWLDAGSSPHPDRALAQYHRVSILGKVLGPLLVGAGSQLPGGAREANVCLVLVAAGALALARSTSGRVRR